METHDVNMDQTFGMASREGGVCMVGFSVIVLSSLVVPTINNTLSLDHLTVYSETSIIQHSL